MVPAGYNDNFHCYDEGGRPRMVEQINPDDAALPRASCGCLPTSSSAEDVRVGNDTRIKPARPRAITQFVEHAQPQAIQLY